jgi:hypothetical protein
MAMEPEIAKSSSLLHSVKLVAWSSVGIRSRSGYQEDLARVNPMHVVAVGLVGALFLVLGLIMLATWMVSK